MGSDLTKRLQDDFAYHSVPGALDELLGAGDEVRPSWRYFMDSMTSLGTAELADRQRKAANLLRDDGATYRVYHGSEGEVRDSSWRLDLLPWLIESDHWREIEGGLLERAELFNLILEDIYGDRELIRRGIIPPEVIFAHRGFLRSCQGVKLPGQHQLIQHATDLARRSDGSMCVLSDRAQAPSGAGYALENRVVMTRVLPSVFRDSNVHRLSGYFQSLRSKLLSLAPHHGSPNIAILTPGSLNETYFEHVYLANYLGFDLVQSSDLAVRNNTLWMKALDGWSRVDVLLRRVDDYFCDPVELKGDSQLGVPGLLEVARAGNVVIANPLGSGVLETPALLPYLPEISRHFLGHDLSIPSVATWWCGDPEQLAYVRAHFDELVIKPVFRSPGAHSVFPAELSKAKREELLQRVIAKPVNYVAQESITPSHLPALGHNGFLPRPALLRAFAVAGDTSYRMMPGGLTRIGTREGVSLISSQSGSISKDTWIVASEPKKQAEFAVTPEVDSHAMARVTGLPSRVVENMFWFGRYAERAEYGLRLLRTLLLQAADIGSANDMAQDFLLRAVVQTSDSAPTLAGTNTAISMDNCEELLPVLLDPQRRESLTGCIYSMLACADESKEMMTFDTQRVINRIRVDAEKLMVDLKSNMMSAPEDTLGPILTSLLALSGILHENVNRSAGWNFMDIGRRVERGIQCVNLLQNMLGAEVNEQREYFVLESLLVSSEALIVYRRDYRGKLDLRNVLELMLLDEKNPRGLIFQLDRLRDRAADLPKMKNESRELDADARYLLESQSLLRLAHLEELCLADEETGRRVQLEQMCRRIDHLLSHAAVSLSEKYFEKPIVPQQLLRQTWESD